MSQLAALALRTYVIGIAVAAPVGAMAVVCLDRTLRRGWKAGMATGMGIATADALYAAAASFGVTAVSSLLVGAQVPFRVVGGVALVVMGVRAAMTARPTCERADDDVEAGALGLYSTALGLTLTNPMTIMAFAAVFMSAGIEATGVLAQSLVATLGVAMGSLTWWLVLVTGTWLLRSGVGPKAQVWLARASGSLVAAFGVLAVASAFFAA